MAKLRPEALTWTALLGRWIEYAQATVSLPDDAEGARWKKSVPAIINLQAVTFALGDIDHLPADDQALARDKAELLIDGAQQQLDDIWSDGGWPANVREIVDDARAALLAAARNVSGGAAVTELVWPGPGTLIMPEADVPTEALQRGWLSVMMPGTIVMPSEPVAWWRDNPGIDVPACRQLPAEGARQVYRQLDDDGRIARDYIAPVADELPPGLPLLVPLVADGERIGRFTMDAATWLAKQRAAFGEREAIPVEYAL